MVYRDTIYRSPDKQAPEERAGSGDGGGEEARLRRAVTVLVEGYLSGPTQEEEPASAEGNTAGGSPGGGGESCAGDTGNKNNGSTVVQWSPPGVNTRKAAQKGCTYF